MEPARSYDAAAAQDRWQQFWEADGTFVFVEQWADADALQAHSTAPAIATLFGTVGDHLDGAPDIKMLQPVVAGDPSKGQLRS